jgi:small conductance mechanosensitive channel
MPVDVPRHDGYAIGMNLDLAVLIATFRGMALGAFKLLPNILIGTLVLVAFYLAAKGFRRLVKTLTSRFHANAGLVFGRLAQGAIVILGLLVSASIVVPSFKGSDVIGILGIGSVAIGFAFRDILQNFLAGILLLLLEPFRIGDQIVVKDFEGTVEEIQTRATLIKTYDGRRVVIPNASLFTESVVVNTAFKTRRMQYDVGVGYGDGLDEVERILLDAVRGVPGVLAEPAPDVLVVDLAASSVNVRVRWWTEGSLQTHVLQVQSSVLKAAKQALVAAGVDLPFPTQQVLFHDQTEETDGDRARQREGWPAGKASPKPRGIAVALREIGDALRERGAPEPREASEDATA